MNPDAVQVGQILFAVLMFIVGISGVGLVNRYLKRRIERAEPPERDARLDRLEQAVDAIAIEVERMSEAQRFTAKLLSDRPPSGARQEPMPQVGHATPV
jgi:hypothetical protein